MLCYSGGTPSFAVGTFKFLHNPAGTPPQFLHADHAQADGMFGILHLNDDVKSTEVLPPSEQSGDLALPRAVMVCACGKTRLPSKAAWAEAMRDPHYDFVCEEGSGGCAAEEDRVGVEEDRIFNVMQIFDEVLDPPFESLVPVSGAARVRAGDGSLVHLDVIHRGPTRFCGPLFFSDRTRVTFAQLRPWILIPAECSALP